MRTPDDHAAHVRAFREHVAALVAAWTPFAWKLTHAAATRAGVRSPEDLEDLGQAALTGLARAAQIHEPHKGAFGTIAGHWISFRLRTAVGRCWRGALYHAPAGTAQPGHLTDEALDGLASREPDPDAAAIRADDRERVERLLRYVEPRRRKALRLRFLEGRSYREIAREFHVGAAGAQMIVISALRRLRELVDAGVIRAA